MQDYHVVNSLNVNNISVILCQLREMEIKTSYRMGIVVRGYEMLKSQLHIFRYEEHVCRYLNFEFFYHNLHGKLRCYV